MEYKNKDSKKILLFSNWYPNRVKPFSGDFVQRHAEAISTIHKVKVVFVTLDPSIKKVEIEEFESDHLHEIKIYIPASRLKLINFLRKSYWVTQFLRKENQADIIHLHVMFYHFWPLLFTQKPFVVSEHFSVYLEENRHKISMPFRRVVKRLLKKASIVTAVSQSLINSLEQIQPFKEGTVIPNVVDTELFKAKENSSKNRPFEFLHISNLAKVKNIEGILQAVLDLVKTQANFHIQIGGNGNTFLIENFVEKHQLQKYVSVLPAMSHQEVAQQMQDANAFILFSNYENQPCVIVESFSCGLPVIATDVGGVAEYFPNDFGILIEKGNIEALKEAMRLCINGYTFASPETMHEFVESKFSKHKIAEAFDKVYTKALER